MMIGDSLTEKYIKPKLSVSTDEELVSILNVAAVFYTVIVGISGVIFPAPYGRYSNGRYGLLLPTKVSWIIQESPSALVAIFLLLTTENGRSIPFVNSVFLFLFLVHYVQRAFIQPIMTVSCSPTPLLVVISALMFTLFNGYLQGFVIISVAKYSDSWLFQWEVLLGLCLFFSGFVINVYHDHLLRKLREPNEKVYKIPQGGLFRVVSCANYLGEIIEWWGFYFATQTHSALIFASFSTLFLGSRGWNHHKFYLKKFDNYPETRKAVIPFIL